MFELQRCELFRNPFYFLSYAPTHNKRTTPGNSMSAEFAALGVQRLTQSSEQPASSTIRVIGFGAQRFRLNGMGLLLGNHRLHARLCSVIVQSYCNAML